MPNTSVVEHLIPELYSKINYDGIVDELLYDVVVLSLESVYCGFIKNSMIVNSELTRDAARRLFMMLIEHAVLKFGYTVFNSVTDAAAFEHINRTIGIPKSVDVSKLYSDISDKLNRYLTNTASHALDDPEWILLPIYWAYTDISITIHVGYIDTIVCDDLIYSRGV